jgi:hypothetical protein
MSELKFVTIDRILAKLNRDLKGSLLNEGDVIEMIGESLEFLKVPQVLEQSVAFLKVEDYHAVIPDGLHMVTQIARNNKPTECTCPASDVSAVSTDEEVTIPVNVPCECNFTCPDRILNPDWTYEVWTSSPEYERNYSVVRLATGTFFNSLVCKEKDESLYMTCEDEYTIVGTVDKRLRFNFIEGQVAIAYLRNTIDQETGYPLVPEHISYISAITYYIKWKLAEMYEWAGRDGWAGKADKAEARWIKYARQAKNEMKMPKTLDQYQNLLEQTHQLIPNHRRYYGYFGNLGKDQPRIYNTLNKVYG